MTPETVKHAMRKEMFAITLVLALGACTDETGPQATDLTETYGCGYGFYVSDEAQSVGLFIQVADFEAAASGALPADSELDDPIWDARLDSGSDLFANWCDDVIEPGEPEPVVDESWDVTGSVRGLTVPDTGQCGTATAQITDIVATGPDGTEMHLGDLDVVNESWGCFAG